MLKGKVIFALITFALLSVLLVGQGAQAWPSDDQGGAYYTVQVPDDKAPTIDGQMTSGEWATQEEFFQDSYPSLTYAEGTVSGITVSIILLQDSNYLYAKVTWENTVDSANQDNSIGLAFASEDPGQMRQTYDRKVAFWNASSQTTSAIDLWNCENANATQVKNQLNQTLPEFCSTPLDVPGAGDSGTTPTYSRPGVLDSGSQGFNASFGYDGKAFFEYQIPLEAANTTEDYSIKAGTYIEVVVNPFTDIVAGDGHGGRGSAPLFIQYKPRCFFCRPPAGMDTSATIFNGFFALMISGIFLTFIFAGISPEFAKKVWKVDVSEDMAKESVVMEMAYYNSSFIGLIITGFFLMYSIIGLLYGFWAQWGLKNYLINGVPILIGIYAFYSLLERNENLHETGQEKLGVDVQDANSFWLVPTLFLAVTLLMLVFIGINVIT